MRQLWGYIMGLNFFVNHGTWIHFVNFRVLNTMNISIIITNTKFLLNTTYLSMLIFLSFMLIVFLILQFLNCLHP